MDTPLGSGAVLTVTPDFQPGDPPPASYNDWHEWARIQYAAGLRQKRCAMCFKFCFPQELSGKTCVGHAQRKDGSWATTAEPVCKRCDEKASSPPPTV